MNSKVIAAIVILSFLFECALIAQSTAKRAIDYVYLPSTQVAIIYYDDGTTFSTSMITYDEYGNIYATANEVKYKLVGENLFKYLNPTNENENYSNEENISKDAEEEQNNEYHKTGTNNYYESNTSTSNNHTNPTYKYDHYYQPKTEKTTQYYYNSFGVNSATQYQRGYFKKDGTWVEPHIKTKSNNTNWDNYSTEDNTNPYTTQKGYRARDYSSDAYNYGSGKTIYTGPKGGQYYYNDQGKKVYVPKRY